MKSQFFKDILSLLVVASALIFFILFSYGSSNMPTKKYIFHTNTLNDSSNDLIERDLERVKGVINVDNDSENDMIIIDSDSDIDLNNVKQIFNKWDSPYSDPEIENIFSFVD